MSALQDSVLTSINFGALFGSLPHPPKKGLWEDEMLLFFRSAGPEVGCFSDQLGQPSASPSGGFSSGGCVLTTAQQVSTAGTFAEGHQILSSANGPDSGRKMLPLLQQHDMIQPSITLFK